MALDIGEKRIGVAVSDPDEKIATPVTVIPAQEVLSNSRTFRNLMDDWDPDLLLCGLPLTLSGDEGPQATRIRKVAENISSIANVPVEFTDERLSSSEAKRAGHNMGYDEKAMRGKIDMVAASIFLQAWLDARRVESDV